ncbi:hydrogenase expression/formation protein HypC (plasmid) [Rhizobium etli]|uniref:Hydrogenase expression/formation protein HypC n=1 Tax=Rhizobium etli TaxID=29449 RepID=A0AAN1BM50_RHIET|nr:HypC/HybG/HupF family hydrogenase formation chaperone [Rhizobium etli]ARQ13521.1 hydrogenase expression/formation protein HypC [Rhizobium etli]
MCLAIPVQVKEVLPGGMAKVTLDGVSKIVSTALVDDIEAGDYVVLHVGYALARIDRNEAERTMALIRQAAIGDAP